MQAIIETNKPKQQSKVFNPELSQQAQELCWQIQQKIYKYKFVWNSMPSSFPFENVYGYVMYWVENDFGQLFSCWSLFLIYADS